MSDFTDEELAAHDRRVRAEALRDAADAMRNWIVRTDHVPATAGKCERFLRARADAEEAGHGHCHCAECPPLGRDCGCARADAEDGKP